jgi:predicted dehydrogenase
MSNVARSERQNVARSDRPDAAGSDRESKARVGVIGCGTISEIYIKNLSTLFGNVEVAAIADLVPERAAAKAAAHGIPRVCSVEELLADPSIEVVLNLTVPAAHAEVSLAALAAGKHVHTEKPLAIGMKDADRILALARKKGLRVGSAPDTFLGAGIQTCLRLIDEGAIGVPVAATAFMANHGPEGWHPDPGFFYAQGGGPVFDMGPYYFTALIALLGPARRLSGSVRRTFRNRLIGSGPNAGQAIDVEIPTHAAGTIDFECGAIATFVLSFDVWSSQLPRLEIYGSEGSLSVPDPNTFGGPVRVRGRDDTEWREVPLELPYAENSRGLGLSEMVQAIGTGRPHLASGALAMHALEIMHAVHDASGSGKAVELRCPVPRPEPLGEI